MIRVGLLIPSSNTVMERDLHRELDALAQIHTARMYLADVTPDAEQHMLDTETIPAARRLATVEPDILVFGCTSADALHGPEHTRRLCRQLADASGAATVLTVLSAVIDALTGHTAVAVLTPYLPELGQRITHRLTTAGIPVSSSHHLGIAANRDIGRLTPQDITTAVADMDLHDADALFCSCTNLRAAEARPDITAATGLPASTSNHATIERIRALLANPT